jgi:hypothetical protein
MREHEIPLEFDAHNYFSNFKLLEHPETLL